MFKIWGTSTDFANYFFTHILRKLISKFVNKNVYPMTIKSCYDICLGRSSCSKFYAQFDWHIFSFKKLLLTLTNESFLEVPINFIGFGLRFSFEKFIIAKVKFQFRACDFWGVEKLNFSNMYTCINTKMQPVCGNWAQTLKTYSKKFENWNF